MSFRLPSLVILALIEAEIAGRGRICPPFPGRVILRPFPVRVLNRSENTILAKIWLCVDSTALPSKPLGQSGQKLYSRKTHSILSDTHPLFIHFAGQKL